VSTRAHLLAREAARRTRVETVLGAEDALFGVQRAFVEDTAQFVAACCSRRAGKSIGLVHKHLRSGRKFPGSTSFYITNTRRQAERGFWAQGLVPTLKRLDIPHKLNQNELSCTFPNGSRILLGGANDLQEIETYRGTKTPLVTIDEAQSVRGFISTLIDDIFLPQLADYGSEGQILLTGTPNPSALGYFHEATTGTRPDAEGWSVHRWTMFDNPHMPDPAGFLARYLVRRGWTEGDPKIQREFFGRWVRDSEGLVYPFERKNLVQFLPEGFPREGGWCFILGLDPGYRDATAFVVLAFSERLAQILLVESFQKTGLIPDAVAVEVEQLQERYDFDAIVVDAGGLGKAYAETMIQKYGISAEVAQKTQKNTAIQHLNGDLRAGVLRALVPANEDLLHDASLLQWDYEKVEKAGREKVSWEDLRIDDRTPDHLLDAMLYAHRKCRAYMNSGEADGPDRGTEAWWEKFEEDLWADPVDRRGLYGETLPDEDLR
jgi:hypothetical protein